VSFGQNQKERAAKIVLDVFYNGISVKLIVLLENILMRGIYGRELRGTRRILQMEG